MSYASHENLLSVGSRCKIPRDSNDLRARQIRWKRINGERGLQHGSPTTETDARPRHGSPDNGDGRPPPEMDARPLPLSDASTTWMLWSWGNPLCVCRNLCAYVCLYVSDTDSVSVCELVYVTPKTVVLDSWCARKIGVIARPKQNTCLL